MINGIEIEFLWFDDDIDEVRIRGANGRFSGEASVYLGKGQLAEIAALFRGFPSDSSDTRALEVGTFDPSCAGGGARLRLRCASPAGAALIDLVLRADESVAGRTESSDFSVPVEAAAIDGFVTSLDRMHGQVGARATLARRHG